MDFSSLMASLFGGRKQAIEPKQAQSKPAQAAVEGAELVAPPVGPKPTLNDELEAFMGSRVQKVIESEMLIVGEDRPYRVRCTLLAELGVLAQNHGGRVDVVVLQNRRGVGLRILAWNAMDPAACARMAVAVAMHCSQGFVVAAGAKRPGRMN